MINVRKKEAQKYIETLVSEAKGSSSADPYCYGVREGCAKLLDWMIQQGVIKQ